MNCDKKHVCEATRPKQRPSSERHKKNKHVTHFPPRAGFLSNSTPILHTLPYLRTCTRATMLNKPTSDNFQWNITSNTKQNDYGIVNGETGERDGREHRLITNVGHTGRNSKRRLFCIHWTGKEKRSHKLRLNYRPVGQFFTSER